MNTFIMKKKVGELWYTIPSSIIGIDGSEGGLNLIKRFFGMMINPLRAGRYILPNNIISLPNKITMKYGIEWVTTVAITSPQIACIGFIQLEADNPFFKDGDYIITSTIESYGQILGDFEFSFTIEDGLIANYQWKNKDNPQIPLVIRSLEYVGNSRLLPVVFAVENSDEEIAACCNMDYVNYDILRITDLPGVWVKPIEYSGAEGINIEFYVDKAVKGEFIMPENTIKYSGSPIVLPSYDSLYRKNYIPICWRLGDLNFPLGATITVPNKNATFELVYEAKNFSGYVL